MLRYLIALSLTLLMSAMVLIGCQGGLPTSRPLVKPTQIPGRADLYRVVQAPEHMASVWWRWIPEFEFQEYVVDFTIHSDPGSFFNLRHGLYLMVCASEIAGTSFYFGLQTDVHYYDDKAGRWSRGKGLIFSRWDESDLSFVRVAGGEDGWSDWSDSSGLEGEFIGVRRAYDWWVGDYRMRLAPDGADPDGIWYALHITDKATGITTWAGSLKFPLVEETPVLTYYSYSTLEIYGNRIRPIDIPEWHVSIKPPLTNGQLPYSVDPEHSHFNGEIANSDVQYEPADDRVHLRVGGTTERVGPVDEIVLD